jgi:hypothetical protein
VKHAIINREFGEVRTAIVLGVGRGGTSLIAGCLRALGIPMGMEPHLLKHEWSPIVYLPDGNVNAAATYHLIEEMNRGHERWGWKSPRDIFALKQVVSLVRAPGFVVVTRDLFEASFSGLTYQGVPLEISLYETATVFQSIADELRFCPWPTLILPFAEALKEPESVVDTLCSFLQIEPGLIARERATRFVQPGSNAYRRFDAGPKDPPDCIPTEDLQKDSETLAADLNHRYAAEYLRHFNAIMEDARVANSILASKFSRLQELGIKDELGRDLGQLFLILPENEARYNPQALGQADSKDEFRAALDEVLELLTTSAKQAMAGVAGRPTDSGYTSLARLYRLLQVLIRVRTALQRALYLSGFPPA